MRMMSKWLCSVTTLFTLSGFSAAAETAAVTATVNAPTAFSTFNAQYQIFRAGRKHGNAQRYLHQKDDHYEMGYSSDISWLVFSDKRQEVSTFSVADDGQLRPLHYLMRRSGTGSNRHYEWRLDRQQQQVFTGKNAVLKEVPWQDDWLDPLSYTQQLIQDLRAGKTSFSYQVLNRDANSRQYHYQVEREEMLVLPYGNIRAIRISRQEENSKRQILAWVAPELDYLLVRIWRGEDNVEQFDVQLEQLTWLARSAQSDRLPQAE